MHARRLHSLLLSTLASTVAACGGSYDTAPGASSSGGSSSSSGGVTPEVPLTTPYDCTKDTDSFDRIKTATGVDYFEVRRTGGQTAGSTVYAAGTKCATATDKPACEAALAAADSETAISPSCGNCVGGNFFVYTKGDTVGKITTKEELIAFLAPVDAAAEAWALAWNSGYRVTGQLCKDGWIGADGDGWVLSAEKTLSDCPMTYQRVLLLVKRDGTVQVLQEGDKRETNACAGRRPEGLLPRRGESATSALGRHFAEVARLEAASVDAFRILKRELTAHGAPKTLVRACERAIADEVRHARAMAKLAKRYGANVEKPRVERRPVRDLYAIAAENVVEGCVNETFGAMEALFQAHAAQDPEIRAAMQTIAKDETRHAALSWRVATWLETKLTAAEKKRLAALRDEAVASLADRCEDARDPSLVAIAGIPDSKAAALLTASLRESLWARAA